MRTWALAALALVVAAGCAETEPARDDASSSLRVVAPEMMPELYDHGSVTTLRRAVSESLIWARKIPAERTLTFGQRTLTAREHLAGLERFVTLLADDPLPAELAARVAEHFDVVESSAGGDVLVTGYYEPMIEASLEQIPGYEVPIYGVPPDRLEVVLGPFSDSLDGKTIIGRFDGETLVPYHDRHTIRRTGALDGLGHEIAWARDEVELFFLEVQGSGTLRLPDGRERRMGYAASNGRGYRSIGRLLIDEGHVPRDKMSMQAIRSWLDQNPTEIRRVLDYNRSFVFFELRDEPALGSLGRPVTAGRSIATDRHIFPHGAIAYLDTTMPELLPDGRVRDGGRLARFVLNQDTGGAIRGPDRVDLFFGRGRAAAATAGRMRQRGRLYFLVPKAGDTRIEDTASGRTQRTSVVTIRSSCSIPVLTTKKSFGA